MNIMYKTMESSPAELKKVLKEKPEMVLVVPEENPCHAIVAFNGVEPIGVVVAYERNGEELYISCILVTTDHHRKGVGTELLRMIEKIARDRNLDKLSLHVYDWNSRATALYTKLGFYKKGYFGSGFACWIKRLNW